MHQFIYNIYQVRNYFEKFPFSFRHQRNNIILMGSKKDVAKDQPKTQKCTFHDRGYCKHGKKCNKIHPDTVCEDQNCFNINCEKKVNF